MEMLGLCGKQVLPPSLAKPGFAHTHLPWASDLEGSDQGLELGEGENSFPPLWLRAPPQLRVGSDAWVTRRRHSLTPGRGLCSAISTSVSSLSHSEPQFPSSVARHLGQS